MLGDDASLEYRGSLVYKMLVGTLRNILLELGLSVEGTRAEVGVAVSCMCHVYINIIHAYVCTYVCNCTAAAPSCATYQR